MVTAFPKYCMTLLLVIVAVGLVGANYPSGSCSRNSDCISGSCIFGRCSGTAQMCEHRDGSCTLSREYCSNIFHRCSGEYGGSFRCTRNEDSCSSDKDCCSEKCSFRKCVGSSKSCQRSERSCTFSDECCSKNCRFKKCT